MKILFLVSSFNGLSQRAWLELDRLNHQVNVHVVETEVDMRQAVAAIQPEVIVAPYLKKRIPADIFTAYTCLVVHPGIVGDRGSSSLDWAILRQKQFWGVTILQAVEKMDAGPVWAFEPYVMRPVSKAQLYRHEVTDAAVKALLRALRKMETKSYSPETSPETGTWNRAVTQHDLQFSWTATTEEIIRKINAADSNPGVRVQLRGEHFFAFGAHREDHLQSRAGEILAQRSGAICIGTGDGAVWITHLKREKEEAVKLPALLALGQTDLPVEEASLSPFDQVKGNTYREIWYEEVHTAGYIHFNFYNGAMSTRQCRELKQAFEEATRRPTHVIVLMGGSDLWSNGIHLNEIEASENPAETAWTNIQAMDDLIERIILCESHYIVSALQGNAGGGGVPLALAADKVIARKGIVLNPHTKAMGLYGSEYWTYLLPRRIGTERARQFTEQCLPWGTDIALEVKLIDECIAASGADFIQEVKRIAGAVSQLAYLDKLMQAKQFKRKRDEAHKPLSKYREEELAKMHKNFFEDDQQFDVKRYAFVHKRSMDVAQHQWAGQDLFSKRRAIWRRRKYEPLFYSEQ